MTQMVLSMIHQSQKGGKGGEAGLFMVRTEYSSAGLVKYIVLDLSAFGTGNLECAMTARDCISVAVRQDRVSLALLGGLF